MEETMKKGMREFCCFLTTICIIVAVICPGADVRSAAVPVTSGDTVAGQAAWKDPQHMRSLTEVEFLERLVLLKKISPESGRELEARTTAAFEVEHPEAADELRLGSGHYEDLEVLTRQDFGSAQHPAVVELTALTRVFVDGSSRLFVAVYGTTANMVSSGTFYTWEPMYAFGDGGPGATTLALLGRGVLTHSFPTIILDGARWYQTTYYQRKACQFSTYICDLDPDRD